MRSRSSCATRNGQVRYEAVKALRAARRADARLRAPRSTLSATATRTSRSRRSTRWATSARTTRTSRRGSSRRRRTPPATTWHREAHAFVALAKRAPERAAHVDGGVRLASELVGADVCRARRGRGRRCGAARQAGLRHQRQRPRGGARSAAPAEEGRTRTPRSSRPSIGPTCSCSERRRLLLKDDSPPERPHGARARRRAAAADEGGQGNVPRRPRCRCSKRIAVHAGAGRRVAARSRC